MKVKNMTSASGNSIANQFIILDIKGITRTEYFQSYDSIIGKKTLDLTQPHLGYKVFLDEKYWDYSVTTSKYRNQFLGETKKETQKKIDNGTYLLVNLN